MRPSGDLDFRGCDDRSAGRWNRWKLEALDAPAAMPKHTAKRRLTGDVAEQFHSRGVGPCIDGDAPAFFAVDDRRERDVALQREPAAGVHVADGGAYLRVRVGREVFHQEVDETSVALKHRQELRRRFISPLGSTYGVRY